MELIFHFVLKIVKTKLAWKFSINSFFKKIQQRYCGNFALIVLSKIGKHLSFVHNHRLLIFHYFLKIVTTSMEIFHYFALIISLKIFAWKFSQGYFLLEISTSNFGLQFSACNNLPGIFS